MLAKYYTPKKGSQHGPFPSARAAAAVPSFRLCVLTVNSGGTHHMRGCDVYAAAQCIVIRLCEVGGYEVMSCVHFSFTADDKFEFM